MDIEIENLQTIKELSTKKGYDLSEMINELINQGIKDYSYRMTRIIEFIGDVSNDSGVYIIENEHKCYIGFSKYIRNRISTHQGQLNNNSHFNEMLQHDWNKGIYLFTAKVLEYTNDPNREAYWIKKYNSHITGYNVNFGRQQTLQQRRKIGQLSRGKSSIVNGTDMFGISLFKGRYVIRLYGKYYGRFTDLNEAIEVRNAKLVSILTND